MHVFGVAMLNNTFGFYWNFPSLVGKVSTNSTPMCVLMSDKALTDLYIANKLERQAAHGLFRSLVNLVYIYVYI